jgi:ribosomal-protein-alanine N-acetyltransferase
VIGHIYFNKIQPEELMTRELGYIFNPKYQHMGYATESVKEIIQYGFKTCNVHRIFAHCNPNNILSWKLLERVGMRREGEFKKNIFFRKDENGNPKWNNTYEYALLREEFIKSNENDKNDKE